MPGCIRCGRDLSPQDMDYALRSVRCRITDDQLRSVWINGSYTGENDVARIVKIWVQDKVDPEKEYGGVYGYVQDRCCANWGR